MTIQKMSAWKYISPWTPKVALPPPPQKRVTLALPLRVHVTNQKTQTTGLWPTYE